MSDETPKYEPVSIRNTVEDLSNSLIKDPITFAEKVLRSKPITASITMPVQMHTVDSTKCVTTTIPFYMSNDFSIGNLTNKWDDMVNMDFMNTAAKFLNAIQSKQGESQVTLQSEMMSSKVWKGSEFSGFNVECLFVSTRRTVNPVKIIKTLAAAALPTKLLPPSVDKSGDIVKGTGDQTTAQAWNVVRGGVSSLTHKIGNLVSSAFDSADAKKAVQNTATWVDNTLTSAGLIAPLYYGLKNASGGYKPLANTTLTLQVGEWFVASELLVSSISNISFSKEIIAPPSEFDFTGIPSTRLYDNRPKGSDYHYPLWGKCNISLIPFAMMTKERFESYFRFKTADSPLDDIRNEIANAIGGIKNAIDTFKLP